MNVTADAGAPQVRPNAAPTAAPAPKAQPAIAPATAKPLDSFEPAKNTGGSNPPINVPSEKDATYQHVDGVPFIQGSGDSEPIDWNDIHQQDLGDCYFMASMGEIAKQNPDVIRNAIKDNGDGTYNVRFYEKKGDGPFGWFGHHYEPKDIKVTPDFPMAPGGYPVFAGMDDTDSAGKKELWPALMEKAFAQWKGGYDQIGNGGNPGDAMAALTGKDSSEENANQATLQQLSDALNSGKAVTAGTIDNGKGKQPYDNNILDTHHVYFVTGVDSTNNTVTLRNPWGTWTPDVNMSIGDFNKYFGYVDINPTR